MTGGVGATRDRGSGLRRTPIFMDRCARMDVRRQSEVHEAQPPNGSSILSRELHAGGGECAVPETRELRGFVSHPGGSPDTTSPPTQVRSWRQPINVTDQRLGSTVQEGSSITRAEDFYHRKTECRKQNIRTMSEIIGKDDELERRCISAAYGINAMTDSAANSSAACESKFSTENIQRKAHAINDSTGILLQRNSNCTEIHGSDHTGCYNGDYADTTSDTSRMSAGGRGAPVNPATRYPRTPCTAARSPLPGFLPVEGEEALCLVAGSVPVPNAHSSRYDGWRVRSRPASEKPSAKEMGSVSSSSSAMHSAAFQSVSLSREECGRLHALNGADLTSQNTGAPAVPCGESSVVLLLERITGKAANVLPVSTLTHYLASALPPLAGLHNCAGGGGTYVPARHSATKTDLLMGKGEPLGTHIRYPVHSGLAVPEMKGGTTSPGIQKLPTGKRLEDYYLVGPILDVCVQQQQRSQPESRGCLPHKRLHFTGSREEAEKREGSLSRKMCRRGSFQRNPQEATTTTCSSASCSRNTEKATLPEVNESRKNASMQTTKDEVNRVRTSMLLPPGTVTEGEDSVTSSERRAERAVETSSPPPLCCKNDGVPGTRVNGDGPSPADTGRTKILERTQRTLYSGGRPVLRFAVARSLPVGIQRNPVKIIKSIEKRRIPTSAGGDRLWRRLCERLLKLPPHPNVLSVEAIYEDPTSYHFVFERLEGGELFGFLLREKVIEEHVCQYIVYQILLALHHLHSHNLLHRDIKPENLVFRHRKQRTAEPFTDGYAPSCLRRSLQSSSSTLLPPSSSSRSNISSPTHLYSETPGDPTLTTSSSPASNDPCAARASGVSNSCTHACGSPSKSFAHVGCSHSSTSTPSAHTPGIPSSPSNVSSGSSRRSRACQADETTKHFSLRGARVGQETTKEQCGQAYGGRRADYIMHESMRDYELVLIDFDTCKMMEVPTEEYGEIVAGRRRLVGTYGYLAPEVLCGHVYSTQSDLWSVGIILYILMTGTPPLPMEDMVSACSSLSVFLEMHEKHGGIPFDIPPLSDSPLAQDLCQRLLRLSPKERLSSASIALSHPWFNNLNRVGTRGDSRSMTCLRVYGTSPAPGQTIPCHECRGHMTSEDIYSCRVPLTRAPPPLKLSPSYETYRPPPTRAPENTPLAFPSSSASLLPRACPQADLSTRGCAHVYLPQSVEREEDQPTTATGSRE